MKKKIDILPVILCGGSGTRLWPLSRKEFPKQFIPVVKGKSFLSHTYEFADKISYNKKVITLSNIRYKFLINETLKKSKLKSTNIFEPISRNTAPAILASALNVDANQILIFLPSDHYIPDQNLFARIVKKSFQKADEGNFVVFGIKPSEPSTGFGYIQSNKISDSPEKIIKFVEKPSIDNAQIYFDSGEYMWNAGIFLVKARTVIESFIKFAPNIFEKVARSVKLQKEDGNSIFLDKDSYESCEAESIDYAIMEKSNDTYMSVFNGFWSDVGTWSAFFELFNPDKFHNRISGIGRTYHCQNTSIYSKSKPVVAIGTKEINIINTDDLLLISSSKNDQDIKSVMQEINDHNPFLWGKKINISAGNPSYSLTENIKSNLNHITIKPKESIKKSTFDSEGVNLIVVKGEVSLTNDHEEIKMIKTNSKFIGANSEYTLYNDDDNFSEVIEIIHPGNIRNLNT